ncbi:MAG: hypothetical protein OSB62_02850 [Alphaproteobacteria bacterium]|nr:hypothetical protein [Alphaproteobacteria bacterium]
MSAFDAATLVSESIQDFQKALMKVREESLMPAELHMTISLGLLDKALEIKSKTSLFDHGFTRDEEFRMGLAQIGMQIQIIGESFKVFANPDGASRSAERAIYLQMHSFFHKLCEYFDELCDMRPIL